MTDNKIDLSPFSFFAERETFVPVPVSVPVPEQKVRQVIAEDMIGTKGEGGRDNADCL